MYYSSYYLLIIKMKVNFTNTYKYQNVHSTITLFPIKVLVIIIRVKRKYRNYYYTNTHQ